ncbi:MAG: GH1 family beta-glucosidase [Candidatus Nanopelagicales bacterium]
MTLRIPSDFELGVATAAWQIEGDLAGRGRSIWDDFAEIPGAIVDGATGDPACDHVHRLEEDLDLLAWLGVDAYRFSFSWPRVMPTGGGPTSPDGLGFYDRLVDGLLDRGIKPVATLYHWDLPSPLEAAGGWPERDTAYRFADYAQVVAERFADRVERWATLNEPWCSAFLGYCSGTFAPGRSDAGDSLAAIYHLILGHGLAVERLRAAQARNVGIVLNLIPVVADDLSMEPVVRHIDGLQNRIVLDLLAGRGVPSDLRESCASVTDWAFVRDEDTPVLSAPIDWLGENYYTIYRVAPVGEADADAIGQETAAIPACPPMRFAPREPLTDMGWEILPSGLESALRMATDALPGVPLWVCENGAAIPEVTDEAGIHDQVRTDYVRDHLEVLMRMREKGFDIRGYYVWSLLDNLEWASGWTKKFGIVRVDPATGERTVKDSARWYRSLIAERG